MTVYSCYYIQQTSEHTEDETDKDNILQPSCIADVINSHDEEITAAGAIPGDEDSIESEDGAGSSPLTVQEADRATLPAGEYLGERPHIEVLTDLASQSEDCIASNAGNG